jgi:hypothetical protein
MDSIKLLKVYLRYSFVKVAQPSIFTQVAIEDLSASCRLAICPIARYSLVSYMIH